MEAFHSISAIWSFLRPRSRVWRNQHPINDQTKGELDPMAGDSFSITQTGLQGIETAMQAVSDNLANAQTNGFQAESVDFGALLGEYVAGNALGGGVSVEGI